MVTVYTKEQLTDTLKRGETALVKGQLAMEIRKKYEKKTNVSKGGLIAGGLAAISLLAAPFTGGASLAGMVAGATAMGLTVGSITVSTAELVILCSTAVALYGINKGAKVTFNNDGSVTVAPNN